MCQPNPAQATTTKSTGKEKRDGTKQANSAEEHRRQGAKEDVEHDDDDKGSGDEE